MVLQILLEHGAGINTHSNEFKESALTLACYKGHLDMVRFLLEAGADQEHKTDEMHTALMEASMDGHVEVARLLLDSGAQVNMPTDSFESPLTLAACGGHVDLALLLLERGANIEEVNDEGYTPLMEASREGHEEMAALLLAQGANINAQTEETQETALTLACCGGFLEVADYLLKNGADIELGASTPLMEAAQEGHIELVRFLLENRANVHAQTQTGDTALTYACENGHTDVAEVLLQYGAELEHESEGGRTPLMKACRAGHICTIKFLINKGADVNRQSTSNDHTPLSLACAGGHLAVVELLLKSGADPFHKLKDNSTMLIEASKGGHTGVVQLLLDYPNSMMPALKPANGNEFSQLPNQTMIQQHPDVIEQIQSSPQLPQIDQLEQQTHQQSQLQQTLSVHQKNIQSLSAVLDAQTIAGDQQNQQTSACQVFSASSTGLQDVPEAERAAANQLLFPSSTSTTEAAMSLQNVLMNTNAKNPLDLQESILANMRLMRNKGFKDGLALGLARFGLGNIATNNNLGAGGAAVPSSIAQTPNVSLPAITAINNTVVTGPTTYTATTTTSSSKQKSLLRKNRQPPAPFELNEMTRTHPFFMDLSKTFAASGDNNKQAPKTSTLGEEFKLVSDRLTTNAFQKNEIFQCFLLAFLLR